MKIHRRDFCLSSAATLVVAGGDLRLKVPGESSQDAHRRAPLGERLFPAGLGDLGWRQFVARGFSRPVCGLLHTRAHPAVNGLPLGGLGTGYLTIETDGTFGDQTFFNSGVPLTPWRRPFLAIRMPAGTWVLTTRPFPMTVQTAKDIEYWGHFPIADLEYSTDAPVSVGLRAWSPFLPGDAVASSTPAAIFEIHLRNPSGQRQEGSLIFSFPGPDQAEAQIGPTSLRQRQTLGWYPVNCPAPNGLTKARRDRIQDPCHGVHVRSDNGVGYVLGVLGEAEVKVGRAIGQVAGYPEETPGEWAANVQGPVPPGYWLPPAEETDFSSSLAVEFSLAPGESRIVRILLAYYCPIWKGEGDNCFTRMYATRHADALEVARVAAAKHSVWLRRILAWQEAIYLSAELPVSLREALVNHLYLLAKTSYWSAARSPLGSWCRPEEGLFGMTESTRECPQIECIPCSFYGSVPLDFFFPDLALSTLRGYLAYQFPNGAPPWIFGGITGGAAIGFRTTDGADMATPSPGYQNTLNGPCYVDLFYRYWERTGDREALREFYPSLRRAVQYTLSLRPGAEGIIAVPSGDRNPTQPVSDHIAPGTELDWFEGNGWFGMTSHVGGVHLAMLIEMEKLAMEAGDAAFAARCRGWIEAGQVLMERALWTGSYYLASSEPETGHRSNRVFSAQLDGEWITRSHSLPGAFPTPNVATALKTILRVCVLPGCYGVINFAEPDGSLVKHPGYGTYGMFVPEAYMFAMLCLWAGQRQAGERILLSCLEAVTVRNRYSWTAPNVIAGDTGKRTYGSDYYQNLMLWAVPAALAGGDLPSICRTSQLVARVLDAARS